MFKLAIVLAVTFAYANAVAFRECPGGHPTPDWIISEQCSPDRCTLIRGENWLGRAGFTPRQNFARLDVTLTATFLGIPQNVPIPVGYDNACDFLEDATCPVSAGESYVWDIVSPIDKDFPALNGIQLTIQIGEGTGVAACAIVTVDVM